MAAAAQPSLLVVNPLAELTQGVAAVEVEGARRRR